jgi:bifunctional non-homologous end joining protein LigD
MLAVPWPRPFSDDAWSFELKWDGVRALLGWDGRRTRLESRRGTDVTDRYPELAGFAADRPLVLDGEVVALDERNRPSFELLQSRINLAAPSRIADAAARAPISYIVFDALYDGEDVTAAPIEERRSRLGSVALPEPIVAGVVVPGDSAALWQFVVDRDLEGIVAKRVGSPYRPGARSPDWRKIAHYRRVRAVVGGFTPGQGGRQGTFGALQLGLWDGPLLRWIGGVGSGFDERSLAAIRAALDEMRVERCPFARHPELPKDTVWVQPRLIALVQFKEWTAGGRLRGPSFKGFTADPPEVADWTVEGP